MSNKTPYYSCQGNFNSVIGVIEMSSNCWWSFWLNCSHIVASGPLSRNIYGCQTLSLRGYPCGLQLWMPPRSALAHHTSHTVSLPGVAKRLGKLHGGSQVNVRSVTPIEIATARSESSGQRENHLSFFFPLLRTNSQAFTKHSTGKITRPCWTIR